MIVTLCDWCRNPVGQPMHLHFDLYSEIKQPNGVIHKNHIEHDACSVTCLQNLVIGKTPEATNA